MQVLVQLLAQVQLVPMQEEVLEQVQVPMQEEEVQVYWSRRRRGGVECHTPLAPMARRPSKLTLSRPRHTGKPTPSMIKVTT